MTNTQKSLREQVEELISGHGWHYHPDSHSTRTGIDKEVLALIDNLAKEILLINGSDGNHSKICGCWKCDVLRLLVGKADSEKGVAMTPLGSKGSLSVSPKKSDGEKHCPGCGKLITTKGWCQCGDCL